MRFAINIHYMFHMYVLRIRILFYGLACNMGTRCLQFSSENVWVFSLQHFCHMIDKLTWNLPRTLYLSNCSTRHLAFSSNILIAGSLHLVLFSIASPFLSNLRPEIEHEQVRIRTGCVQSCACFSRFGLLCAGRARSSQLLEATMVDRRRLRLQYWRH